MFCLGVTNPESSGLGGGFLMTIYNRTRGECVFVNSRETAPAAAHRDMYKNNSNAAQYGLVEWEELVLPSAKLARRGTVVSEYLGEALKSKERYLRMFPSMKGWINPDTDKIYKRGDIIPRPKLADTLEKIANSSDPVEMFYRGEMAETIIREITEGGGILTKQDLADYKPIEMEPLISTDFRNDLVMCGGPPPSSFAVTQLIVRAMS
ncbi:gamma-glutamyltranspeptidase, partial [Oesophagostomum dentatum]